MVVVVAVVCVMEVIVVHVEADPSEVADDVVGVAWVVSDGRMVGVDDVVERIDVVDGEVGWLVVAVVVVLNESSPQPQNNTAIVKQRQHKRFFKKIILSSG